MSTNNNKNNLGAQDAAKHDACEDVSTTIAGEPDNEPGNELDDVLSGGSSEVVSAELGDEPINDSASTLTDESLPKEQTVVAVKLRYNPKVYWFDPVLSTYNTGDHVLVDTERGREIGLVTNGALQVSAARLKELNLNMKPVIRALTKSDYDRVDELDAKGKEAMPVFREMIDKHNLEMKPVSVDYLFTGDKAVFYFSNDERVDFRELVRDLASHFRIRVDMRQIGVRDEARILGGLAHCGEELCCTRLGGEFQPVSIRMAKEQDLPLNPAKISGACGRLMCCLRYEFEAYKDFKTRAPKKGTLITTPIGQAKVVDFDTPREIISLRLEDGKQLSVPLADFECCEGADGKSKPCSISRETIDRCASSSVLAALAALEQETQAADVRTADKITDSGDQSQNRRLRRSKRGAQADAKSLEVKPTDRKAGAKERRGGIKSRRADSANANVNSTSAPNAPKLAEGSEADASKAKRQKAQANKDEGIAPRKRKDKRSKQRPGQHSSGLRSAAGSANGSGNSTDNANSGSNANSGAGKSFDARSTADSGTAQGTGLDGTLLRRRRRPTNKPKTR